MKKWLFHGILWLPLIGLLGLLYHFIFLTSAPQEAYLNYFRNLNFDCFQMVDKGFVYNLKPGQCQLNNIEYRTTEHIDLHGFRNPDESFYSAPTVLIGDSHAFGLAVKDEDTLSRQLTDHYGIKTLNLSILTYATYRELETLRLYAPQAKNVILQYCDNDYDENQFYIDHSAHNYREAEDYVRGNITGAIDGYHATKAAGLMGALRGTAQMLQTHSYWDLKAKMANTINRDSLHAEASAFARTLATHHDVLKGKHIVVFESSSYGYNSPNFKVIFEAELHKQLPDLDVTVLNTTHIVNKRDYFFFDDHPRPSAYVKFAKALAKELAGRTAS